MYHLKFNEEQARILARALDLYTRIGIGQFESVLDAYDRPCNMDLKKREEVQAALQAAKLWAGHPVNGSYGIHNPKVQDEFRAAFDILQVIRRQVAYDRNPEGGIQVDFDDPMQTSELPLPTIEAEK